MRERINLQRNFEIADNIHIGGATRMMRLVGDTSGLERPGQFVNIGVAGKFLRRPISVCDYDRESITLLYDVVGEGTAELARMSKGMAVDLLLPLGNGFDISLSGDHPLLFGGGIGIAPLYNLAKTLVAEGKHPTVILGFNTGNKVVWCREFASICSTYIATVDGSVPEFCISAISESSNPDIPVVKGFVTDVIIKYSLSGSFFYACGPIPMMRALCETLDMDGELSLDGRMACGFGICMCCSLETKSGPKRICREGPVFPKNELIWK